MVPLGQEETTRAIKKLGPEPFGEDFQLDVFAKHCRVQREVLKMCYWIKKQLLD